MKTLKIYHSEWNWTKVHELVLLQLLLMLIWWSAPWWIYYADKSAAWVDSGIWSLVIIALITFILLIWLCWFLLNSCWEALALPACSSMYYNLKT